jgi:hypothetical protein
MNTHKRMSVLAAAVGLVALTASCSSSSKPKAQSTSGPTASAAKTSSSAAVTTSPAGTTGSGACKYVTTEQASTLAGSPVKAGVSRSLATGPVTFQYCDYIFDPGNAPGVTVAIAGLDGNASALFAQFRAAKQSESEYQVVPGVGDEAFYANGNLNIRSGNTGLILYVGRTNGFPRGPDAIPDEKKLAELVISQL